MKFPSEGILAGVTAATVAAAACALGAGLDRMSGLAPALCLGMGLLLAAGRAARGRAAGSRSGHRADARHYDGIADLQLRIHCPTTADSYHRWLIRGSFSAALALLTGAFGIEGAAIEWSQAVAMRAHWRTARWFEQLRRTDASVAVAAGVAAVFGAPLTAVTVALELGTGGRALAVLIAALTAALLPRIFGAGPIGGLPVPPPAAIGGGLALQVLVIGTAGGWASAGAERFVRYCRATLRAPFRTRPCAGTLVGVGLIVGLSIVSRRYHLGVDEWLRALRSGTALAERVPLVFGTQLFLLSLSLAIIGSAGVFWPVLMLGALLGSLSESLLPLACAWLTTHCPLPGSGWVQASAGMGPWLGGAALWGAWLGTPVAGSLLALETTHDPVIFVSCLFTSHLAQAVRQASGKFTLPAENLRTHGLALVGGRSVDILRGLSVADAMVTDQELAHEHEKVSDLHARFARSPYPFLPIVDTQGRYLGLLTFDLIEEAWRSQQSGEFAGRANSPLTQLLEAKDLLYRSALRVRPTFADERLSQNGPERFGELPCVPVLDGDGRVVGLLFVYHVRLAYDQAAARRAMGRPAA